MPTSLFRLDRVLGAVATVLFVRAGASSSESSIVIVSATVGVVIWDARIGAEERDGRAGKAAEDEEDAGAVVVALPLPLSFATLGRA